MGKSKQQGGDPLERLAQMIDEKISSAFDSRDRQAKEASDPWARIEGIIDRSVSKHFEAFARGLEEGGDDEEGGQSRKPRVVKGEKEEGGGLGILGL